MKTNIFIQTFIFTWVHTHTHTKQNCLLQFVSMPLVDIISETFLTKVMLEKKNAARLYALTF